MSRGRELRDARTRRGISVEEAARQARIPPRYIDALERDDLAVFGRGPFASGYTRQYRKFLGLPDAPLPAPSEPEQEVTARTETGPLIPSRPRLAALGAAVVIVLTLAVLVGQRALEPTSTEVGVPPDQIVLVTTGEPLRATVVADDRTVFAGVLPAGQQQRFEAHDELLLDLARLDGVSVVYNGRTLKPLGAQSRPRRLLFIDDQGR